MDAVDFLGRLPLELNPCIYIIILGIPANGKISIVNIIDGVIGPIRFNFCLLSQVFQILKSLAITCECPTNVQNDTNERMNQDLITHFSSSFLTKYTYDYRLKIDLENEVAATLFCSFPSLDRCPHCRQSTLWTNWIGLRIKENLDLPQAGLTRSINGFGHVI